MAITRPKNPTGRARTAGEVEHDNDDPLDKPTKPNFPFPRFDIKPPKARSKGRRVNGKDVEDLTGGATAGAPKPREPEIKTGGALPRVKAPTAGAPEIKTDGNDDLDMEGSATWDPDMEMSDSEKPDMEGS